MMVIAKTGLYLQYLNIKISAVSEVKELIWKFCELHIGYTCPTFSLQKYPVSIADDDW
jgi:hypothetical protein